MRRKSREIRIGTVTIGGDHPIAIQSMTNTKTRDVAATAAQIRALTEADCELVRCTASNEADAAAFSELKKRVSVPLIADIHFDYRLAIAAMEHGADKIRINPGNIGSEDRVRAVVSCARERGIPIRVGVNSGSLEREFLEKYGRVTAEGLAESALRQAERIAALGYENLVVSIKATDIPMCIRAHELVAARTDLPLHVGITEAGTVERGRLRSAVGIGAILAQGIGDTIRVSLTGDPVEEVRAAKEILAALDLRHFGIEVVSCPTCGRTEIDLIALAGRVEEMVKRYPALNLKLAVMGCVVNGPGEAKEADLGIAGGKGTGVLIRRGEILKKLPEEELLPALEYELAHWGEE